MCCEIGEIMRNKIEKHRIFFTTGKTKSFTFRTQMLNRLREAISGFEGEILKALKEDLNRSKVDGYTTEIHHCLAEISFALKNLKKWMRPQRVGGSKLFPLSKGFVVSEPLGTCLIVSPWNYPFSLAILPLIAAIAAGNCTVIKPSEISKNTEAVIFEMVSKYFDEKYISVICGGPEISQELLKEKFDYIFFTGGETVGKIVMNAAAENITPITLELGGKSPCIVDENCDLQKTARRITWGKFLNAGQTCVAPDYLLVKENVKDELIIGIQKYILEFYGENPQDSGDYGRIINENHFDRLNELLKEGEVIFGGITSRKKLYISPTLIQEIPENAKIMNEEIFGPLLPILEFGRVSEAVDFINRRPKPLALYIFSRNKEFQRRIISETSSGGICINDTIVHLTASNLPFGGVGNSGFGKYHGKAGFDAFSNQKSVLHQTSLFDMPKRFPPTKEKDMKMLRAILNRIS
jgi:acyl-CoA reductase-like NAD-dependent aldehyde dehydrogenase